MRFLDLIFPPRCANCGLILASGALCADCRAAIVLNRNFFCGNCRARIPPGSRRSLCHPRGLYVLGAASSYDGAVKELILKLKFRGIRDAAADLASLMAAYASPLFAAWKMPEVLIPIPLSRRRRNERGFNQTSLISAHLAILLRSPVWQNVLVRTRHTSPQSMTASFVERHANLAGAFLASPGIKGRSVLLIDDVTTSGATLREAAIALKRAGAGQITALVAAQA